MSSSTEFSSEHVIFDENGVMITDSHVRTQSKTYALTGSAFSRTRRSDCFEVDPVETGRLRRRLLPWTIAASLVFCSVAAWYFGETVQAQSHLNGGTMTMATGRAIAFVIGGGISALAGVGVFLCARVERKYRMYHVYLDTRSGRREIARSRNEAWITAIAASLDKAIARLSVATGGSAAPEAAHGHSRGSFAAS